MHYAVETYGGCGDIASPFLTSALDGGERSASRPGRFTPGTHCVGAWMGPEPVWTLSNREKFLFVARNRTLAIQPVTHHCTEWTIPAPNRNSYTYCNVTPESLNKQLLGNGSVNTDSRFNGYAGQSVATDWHTFRRQRILTKKFPWQRENNNWLFEMVLSLRFVRSYKTQFIRESREYSSDRIRNSFRRELSVWTVILRTAFVTVEEKTLVVQ
jgi:hypothetical protein